MDRIAACRIFDRRRRGDDRGVPDLRKLRHGIEFQNVR
jgi:hypothetical protein